MLIRNRGCAHFNEARGEVIRRINRVKSPSVKGGRVQDKNKKFYSPAHYDSQWLLSPESEGDILARKFPQRMGFESKRKEDSESTFRVEHCFSGFSLISTQNSERQRLKGPNVKSNTSISTNSEAGLKCKIKARGAENTNHESLILEAEQKAVHRMPDELRLLSFTTHRESSVTIASIPQTLEIREATEEDRRTER